MTLGHYPGHRTRITRHPWSAPCRCARLPPKLGKPPAQAGSLLRCIWTACKRNGVVFFSLPPTQRRTWLRRKQGEASASNPEISTARRRLGRVRSVMPRRDTCQLHRSTDLCPHMRRLACCMDEQAARPIPADAGALLGSGLGWRWTKARSPAAGAIMWS